MSEEDPVPMDTSQPPPEPPNTSASTTKNSESGACTTSSNPHQEASTLEKIRTESEEQIEAANTLVLLQDAGGPSMLKPPRKRKRRKSGTPQKRAFVGQEMYDSPISEETLEVDPSAITHPGLVRVAKDPTPISNYRQDRNRARLPMKLYYESLMRKIADASDLPSATDTQLQVAESQPLPVTQFFQTTTGEEIAPTVPKSRTLGEKPKTSSAERLKISSGEKIHKLLVAQRQKKSESALRRILEGKKDKEASPKPQDKDGQSFTADTAASNTLAPLAESRASTSVEEGSSSGSVEGTKSSTVTVVVTGELVEQPGPQLEQESGHEVDQTRAVPIVSSVVAQTIRDFVRARLIMHSGSGVKKTTTKRRRGRPKKQADDSTLKKLVAGDFPVPLLNPPSPTDTPTTTQPKPKPKRRPYKRKAPPKPRSKESPRPPLPAQSTAPAQESAAPNQGGAPVTRTAVPKEPPVVPVTESQLDIWARTHPPRPLPKPVRLTASARAVRRAKMVRSKAIQPSSKPAFPTPAAISSELLQMALKKLAARSRKPLVSFTVPSTITKPASSAQSVQASTSQTTTTTTTTTQKPISSPFAQKPVLPAAPKPVSTATPTQPPVTPPASTSGPHLPPTDLKGLLSSLKTLPKGLNMPVTQFLQVNNLLAKTLQMQQKVLQSQETAISKALASQSPQGTTVQTSPQATLPVTTLATSVQPSKTVTSTVAVTSQTSIPPVQDPPSQAVPVPVTIPVTVPVTVPVLLAAGETSEAGPASSSPSQAGPTTSAAGKSPVFIHIISKSYLAPPTQSRPKDVKATPLAKTVVKPSSPPRPAPLPASECTKLHEELTVQTSRAKSQAVQLAKSLVELAENEIIEVDVVGVPEVLELPPHLRDHDYMATYNPGEREIKPKIGSYKSSANIPPARVSYAPPLPDSPTLLFKLLKVNRKSKAGKSKPEKPAPVIKPKQGRFTPSGGHVRRAGRRGSRCEGTKGGRGSKNGSESRAQSEEASASSASEHSDTEGIEIARRRSQRITGQRKRYIDDINISLSDEESQELIVSLPQTRTIRHDDDDDDGEYGDEGDVVRTKTKTKSAPINPTEGFQYSDMYFEPPAEEAEVVERILTNRTRDTVTEEEKKRYGEKVEEFLVKYKSYSYLHAKWATFEKVLRGDKRFDGKVKRYRSKRASLGVFEADEEPFNPDYTVVDRVLDKAVQEETNEGVVIHYLIKWCSLPYEDATWELQEDVDSEAVRLYDIRSKLPDPSQCTFVSRPPPSGFKPVRSVEYRDGNKLRSYQLEGVNWLLFNWYTRQNCILADEMGLGKTVQSIALLQEIHNTGIQGPFLVIAPLSTITNWQREVESWTSFNIIVYHGSAYSRRLIHEYELYHRDDSGRVIPNTYKFDVIITTYEVILSDDSELRSVQWRVVIIDEAHRLKNRNCKLLEELKAIQMEHRVLLTGTPLQNNVEELFSLLNFLEPSTFTSHLTFLQQFGELKTEEQVEELKGILKPMMLRRLKEDVEKSLAPKEETIVEVELTVMQKQYYRAILEKNFTFLSKSGGGGAMPSLLNVMMELRKCCNHPFLIQGAEQQIVTDYQRQHPDHSPNECLVQASGKLVLISKLLPKLKANGHKVLIFSQMVRCLDMLEDFLRMKGYQFERIDGNVRGTLRQAAIDRFSKPNSDRFVFLLCTRAGGLGINLTAADTVIIYDSDWNPQNDLQAQARCHRIGQNKAVKVYRLITRNTYERDMFDRASLKLGLDKAVLQSSGSASTGSGPPQLSKKEVEELLKRGAYGALMDEDDDANKFCEEDIDQILERRTQVIQLESEGKGSTFAKASFSADGSTDISIDDPNFWQKWAEKARLDLDELANKDTLVIDTPRQRRQVRRYGNDDTEEVVDMGEIIDEVVDVLPSRGKQGWTKLECLKVEKGLLTYGWANWKQILSNSNFRKRQLGAKDIENIARTILIYCMSHFTGDDKVVDYINKLIDPGIVTETETEDDGFYQVFTEQDLLELRAKPPDTLFEDITYMKHLERHSNKILLRARQLHILRWTMLADKFDQIMEGTPVSELNIIDLPRPEEPPPAPWWTLDCDHSLLVGIIKHGYEMFGPMRADRALSFRALCGEEPRASSKKKKAAIVRAAALAARTRAALGEESDRSGDDSEWEDGIIEELPGKKIPRAARHNVSGFHSWPILADVNTRARRYVSTWLRQQRKEEIKQHNIQREYFKKEKEAEHQRKREQRKAELAQKWSKREEQDFTRVVSYYGVVFNAMTNKYDWSNFRVLASLTKKSDERLTLYFHDFKRMCWRVFKKKPPLKRGLSGIAVEAINEERASRCLQKINVLSAVREEVLPHPEFDKLIKLCELSFEVPSWWVPIIHDEDLLKGVAEHGFLHTEELIYHDPQLRFKETIPQSALYDPNIGLEMDHSSSEDDDDEERPKRKEGQPVPLGWPKEKAIIIRLSRIVFAFRQRVWPRPMEGLDLFVPSVKDDQSSSESDSDVPTSDEEWGEVIRRRAVPREPREASEASEGVTEEVDVGEEVRDFEIEKSQGLKLTLKKAPRTRSAARNSPPPDNTKLMIRIPLVQLKFASSTGLKRIPKKRPLEQEGEHNNTPEAKKQKTSTPQSKYLVIVDPCSVEVEDLGGQERVGVVNRNTGEKLPLRQSPMLKNLSLWLDGHPHFNVEPDWGDLVIEWGALKPDMHSRVLRHTSEDGSTETHEPSNES